ncbi:BTB/POZ domain-containing protein kctd15-like [Diadema antillarum]|uniref:BTB/POZ domain-containing protein kctd15-like n=1 Tax=Diadema antillarum TaxID=105358 RepID=UPI003A862CEB
MNTVSVNVGGTIYTTSKATLCRFPDSRLALMFSDQQMNFMPPCQDRKGNYIIDGDGPLFRHVLNFLRRSVLVLPEDFQELDMLAQEADHYQINELIEAVTKLRNAAEREKEEVEKIQEFVELQFFHGYDEWVIFGSWDILQTIPVVMKYVEDDDREKINSEVWGIKMSTSYGRPAMNRIKLYEQIAKLGFKVVPLSSSGGDSVDKWIFARDAKTTSGTDPKGKSNHHQFTIKTTVPVSTDLSM